MGFAENVKNELECQDIQIKELADKTGISKNTLDKYLSGKKVQPGVENAVRIASALGVSVEYLVNGASVQEIIPPMKTSEYQRVLRQYHVLNDFNKKTVSDLLKSLVMRQ